MHATKALSTAARARGCYAGCVCVDCLAEAARMTREEYRAWVREHRHAQRTEVVDLVGEVEAAPRRRLDGEVHHDEPLTDAEVEAFLTALGRKVEPEDVTRQLRRAAASWLARYEGDFAFLVDIKQRGRQITDGQAKGILNCWRADVLRRPKATTSARPESGTDIAVLDGYYAYQPAEGQAQFYRVDAPSEGRWAGWRFVKHQLSDDFERAGSQRPGQTYQGGYGPAMRAIAADPQAAQRLYGQLIGKCGRCGRTLTNEESREYGIGPECRKH